jgi:glycerol-3-phosphate acyltransferase PlsY
MQVLLRLVAAWASSRRRELAERHHGATEGRSSIRSRGRPRLALASASQYRRAERNRLVVTLTIFLAALFGYLLGSIPFGLVLTKLAGEGDIRSIGSGNIGATNVLRTGRKGLAAATLSLDGLKATVAILIALHWGREAGMAAAAGAFLGHLFPVWLGFKGGKGVATYLGCLLGLCWPAAFVFAAIWLAVAFVSKYSSAAALTAMIATPIAIFLMGLPNESALFMAMGLLSWVMHRANIARLLDGTEGKIGKKG